jgi:hypothetical protein
VRLSQSFVVPFVFLAGAVVAIAYLVRGGHPQIARSAPGGFSHNARSGWVGPPRLVGIRGWLAVYVIALAIELAHNLALTIGSLVIFASPSLVGLHSFIPLWALVIYVVSNLGLVTYGVVLFGLMSGKRKAAILHNIVFNALTIAFLIVWFLLSAKSPIGTIVDSLPALAAIAYISRSRRVSNTFTAPPTR